MSLSIYQAIGISSWLLKRAKQYSGGTVLNSNVIFGDHINLFFNVTA